MESLRIMSYNIRTSGPFVNDGKHNWKQRRKHSISMINNSKPHVIGIQEGHAHQLDYLVKKLSKSQEMQYRWIGKKRGAFVDFLNGNEHCAIVYNDTLLDCVDHATFKLNHPRCFDGIISEISRIATWALFSIRGTDEYFTIVNTHLDHKSAVHRLEQIQLVTQTLMTCSIDSIKYRISEGPIILTVDLNDTRDSETYEHICNGDHFSFQDAWKNANPTSNETFSFHHFEGKNYVPTIERKNRHIDFIFYRNIPDHWKLTRCHLELEQEDQISSDHFALSAVFHVVSKP